MRTPHTIGSFAIIAALLFAAVTTPSPAPAQSTDIASIREAIDRNTELLMEATALVRSTNSTKARVALEAARKLHELSISQLTLGNRLMAGRAARDARDAILRAIAIARSEAKLEEGAVRAMERAATRLERARAGLDEFGGGDSTPARKLVEEAHDQLQRAQNSMHEHMFEVALQLANASADMSTRAIGMLTRDVATPELVRREIERTAEVIARLDEHDFAGHPNLFRVLEDIRDLQKRAVHSARSENWQLAHEQTNRARDMALRIMRMPGPSDANSGDVLRALEFTDEVLARAAHIAREDGLDDVLRKIDQATQIQTRARGELERGRAAAAIRLTMSSRDMAKDALGSAQKPIDREAVAGALDRTDTILARLRADLEQRPDPPARAILDRAVERQASARNAFTAGELRRALALTKVARTIAARADLHPGDDDE